jgi:predicted unusual protein kinase regulating ubiquinone biosynthesis (AarF/ABC1/UbiB family)
VAALSREFRDVLFDFPFQVPQDFIYLGRALGMLSGLSSLLNPELNPWHQIERYGRKIIAREEMQQFGREAILQWLRRLAEYPGRLDRTLATIEQGRLRVQSTPDRATPRRLEHLEKQMTRLQLVILGAAGMISGMLYLLYRRRDDR